MSTQKVRTRIRRFYMTLPDRFDFALEMFPGAMMVLGGAIVLGNHVF